MRKLGLFILLGWLFRIVIIAVFVLFGLGAIVFLTDNTAPPPPDKAQYSIQTYSTDGMMTPSRIYFTDEIIPKGDTPIIKDYWWFDGENYKHVKKDREFTEPIKIVRRAK